jgi:hypothetical protein
MIAQRKPLIMKYSNTMKRAGWLSALLACAVIPHASAVSYGFAAITSNSAVDAGTAGQYSVGVTDASIGGVNIAKFTFSNAGPLQSTIAQIYFQDGTLLGISSIINGPGVSFQLSATPQSLPAGMDASPPFVTTKSFDSSAISPAPFNGVNPGEFVCIFFNLINGKTFADTIAAIASGDLRFGIHVINFGDGQSESFVGPGTPGTPVPDAASTLLLLAMGLGGIVAFRKKVLA